MMRKKNMGPSTRPAENHWTTLSSTGQDRAKLCCKQKNMGTVESNQRERSEITCLRKLLMFWLLLFSSLFCWGPTIQILSKTWAVGIFLFVLWFVLYWHNTSPVHCFLSLISCFGGMDNLSPKILPLRRNWLKTLLRHLPADWLVGTVVSVGTEQQGPPTGHGASSWHPAQTHKRRQPVCTMEQACCAISWGGQGKVAKTRSMRKSKCYSDSKLLVNYHFINLIMKFTFFILPKFSTSKKAVFNSVSSFSTLM